MRARTTFCPLDPRSDPFSPQRTERVSLCSSDLLSRAMQLLRKRASGDQLCTDVRTRKNGENTEDDVFPGISILTLPLDLLPLDLRPRSYESRVGTSHSSGETYT